MADDNAQDKRCDHMSKKTNNHSMMRYKWIQQIRRIIITDLKRHFGREIMHDRLFSCLGKTTIDYHCLFAIISFNQIIFSRDQCFI